MDYDGLRMKSLEMAMDIIRSQPCTTTNYQWVNGNYISASNTYEKDKISETTSTTYPQMMYVVSIARQLYDYLVSGADDALAQLQLAK